jgi:Leucine-rich repeat (LRR) protein
LRRTSLGRLTVGLLSLHLFAGGAVSAPRPPGSLVARAGSPGGPRQDEGAFDSLEKALREPEKVRRLALQGEDPEMKQLPPGLGKLVNLEALELACLEKLEALPEEIGELQKLQQLVIDNGNGCSMNVSLPGSVGRLANLRVLRLYGALDGRDAAPEGAAPHAPSKVLPDALAELRGLEELDLGRNGLVSVPPQVASLRGLKKLSLDYNDIRELPSFVGDLPNLRELSVNANGGVKLPQSLAKIRGLKVFMGNNRLKLRDQSALRTRFPNAVFSFENDYDDDAANQEPPKPKARRR